MTSHDLQRGDGPRGDRPRRRHFSAEYKLRIVAEYESNDRNLWICREGCTFPNHLIMVSR